MLVTKREALNHEEHGVYYEAQVWKKIVALSLLSFFIWALRPLFFLFLFCSLAYFFLTWDNALIMMMITLLFTHSFKAQNDDDSIGNASDSVPGCAMI